MCMVVLPSGVIVNQMEGVKLDMPVPAAASALPLARTPGSPMLRNPPAAVAADRTRNSRLVVPLCAGLCMAPALPHDLGGALDGAHDAGIGGTAAEIAGHALDDLLLARIGVGGQQRRRLHDLARLAVAALRHLML